MEPHSSARMEFDRLASRRLFLILLLLVVGVHLVLLADHRLPRRHRTRLHYELQYALLSGSAHPGCVPLWMPFASHGTVSNWALFETSGLVLSPLMLAGPALVGADFQICFHLGVLAEELVLLIGCWMLSRRFFRSPLAAFFTTASALGSAFWLDEMSLNLHAIFALPLLLELLHRHFDDGSRKAMFLAANLAAVQALGGPLPAGLVTPISAAIYFAARTVLQKEPWTRKLAWGPLLMGASALLPVLVTASWGAGALVGASELVRPGPGDAIVYSGLGNPLRYLDLFLGAGPSLDWSIYCGALTVGLALAAAPPSSLARLAAALATGLLLLGTSLYLSFLCCPSLRPLRPLPYGTPIVRLFLIFLAGAGLQRALEARDGPALKTVGRGLLTASLSLVALSWIGAVDHEALRELFHWVTAGESAEALSSAVLEPWAYPGRMREALVPGLLGTSAVTAGAAGGLLYLLGGRTRNVPFALTLILVLHPLDVFGWKLRASWLESFPANTAQRALQRVQPAPYVPRRGASIAEAPRYRQFHSSDRFHPSPEYAPRTSNSWPSAGYWQADAAEGPGHAEYWMSAWGRLATALGGTPEGGDVESPWIRPPGSLLAGRDDNKLQFFAAARSLPADEIARLLGSPDSFSRVLPIEGNAGMEDGFGRLPLAARVSTFESNELSLDVDVPQAGAWLYYADAWDPGWTATVNGAPREIARAALAYKALRLDSGTNRVVLRYASPARSLCAILLGVDLLLWVLWTLQSVFFLAAVGRAPR